MTLDLSFLICEMEAHFKLLSGMFLVSNRPSECVSPAQELFAQLTCACKNDIYVCKNDVYMCKNDVYVCKNDVYVCKNDVWCCPQTQCV